MAHTGPTYHPHLLLLMPIPPARGRRPLLLVGATGIVISLSALAVTQWDGFIQLAGGTDAVAVVSVTAMLLFLACFQVRVAAAGKHGAVVATNSDNGL